MVANETMSRMADRFVKVANDMAQTPSLVASPSQNLVRARCRVLQRSFPPRSAGVWVPGATPQPRLFGHCHRDPVTKEVRRPGRPELCNNKESRSKAAKIHAENSGPLFASPDWFLAGDCIAVAQDGIVLAHSGS